MLAINNAGFAVQKKCTQNNQKQNAPRLSSVNQSGGATLSFKLNEDLFIKRLQKLCKDDGDTFLEEEVMGLAHDVDPKHPDIIAEFERVKNDNTVPRALKKWIGKDLVEMLGIGGNIFFEDTPHTSWFSKLFGKK